MEILSLGLSLIGLVIFVIGGIWYIVVCFQESIWWGLGTLFLPFIEFIFLLAHWNEAKKPFMLQILGGGLIFAGAYLLEP